jgi:hypothetical protein
VGGTVLCILGQEWGEGGGTIPYADDLETQLAAGLLDRTEARAWLMQAEGSVETTEG